jgi:general L-amino acid transport system substrate-binding protein
MTHHARIRRATIVALGVAALVGAASHATAQTAQGGAAPEQAAPAGPTLKAVKERGTLRCGVSEGIPGFSAPDAQGQWSGFDVDLCRAVAAAVFNDARKVAFTPLAAGDRFAALKSGQVDLLSRNTTWTMGRETELGLAFAGVTYYDGQGFLVRKSENVASALELDAKPVCTQSGTTTELNVADYFRNNKMKLELVTFPTAAEAEKAYDSDRCKVLTSDVSQLYATRLKLAKPGDHMILPDIISKEPLGPLVRQGDEQWFNIVKWVHFAMLNAEELGVSSRTIGEAARSEKPDVKRLVGTDGHFGAQIGLTDDWAARVITLVGNYDEVFERNVGVDSKLGIPRGLNSLWSKGGIQYAPPIR